MKPNKTPTLHQIDDYQLPNEVLVGLMGDVLAQGCKFKFQAKGASMSPFIRDKDNITIDPIRQVKPSMGRVVAYACSDPQKLLVHRIVDAVVVSHISDVKLELGIIKCNSHILLFFFIPTEDADLAHIGIEKPAKYGIAERTGATGDHQNFISKHRIVPYLNLNMHLTSSGQGGAT